MRDDVRRPNSQLQVDHRRQIKHTTVRTQGARHGLESNTSCFAPVTSIIISIPAVQRVVQEIPRHFIHHLHDCASHVSAHNHPPFPHLLSLPALACLFRPKCQALTPSASPGRAQCSCEALARSRAETPLCWPGAGSNTSAMSADGQGFEGQ